MRQEKNAVKPSWRDYLNGTHTPTNERDMRFKVRAAAKRSMADLLLILEKADEKDLELIFHESGNRENLVLPLLKKFYPMRINLEHERKQENEDREMLFMFMRDFDKWGVSYNKPQLLRSGRNHSKLLNGAKGGRYLKQKRIELLIKQGLPRKQARHIVRNMYNEVKDSTQQPIKPMNVSREN